MLRSLTNLLLLFAVFALGGWLTYRDFVPQKQTTEDATVLLEKIQAVSKLITVE